MHPRERSTTTVLRIASRFALEKMSLYTEMWSHRQRPTNRLHRGPLRIALSLARPLARHQRATSHISNSPTNRVESTMSSPSRGAGNIAPCTATPAACISLALQLADLRSTDTLLDVGCNDARVLLTASSSTRPETSRPRRCIGVEILADAARRASDRVNAEGFADRIEIVHADVTLTPHLLREASVVFLFMALQKRTALKRILARECRAGTRIVTYLFPLHEMAPKKLMMTATDDEDDIDDGDEDDFNSWFVRSESVQSTRPNGMDVSRFSTVYLYRVVGPMPPREAEVRLPMPSSVTIDEFKDAAVEICARFGVPGFVGVDVARSGEDSGEDDAGGEVKCERILGGITNELVRLRSGQSDADPAGVVVRVFGPSSELFINRERELEVVQQMSRMGSGARVLGSFANGRVEAFIAGSRVLSRDDVIVPGNRTASTLHAMARCVRDFHERDVTVTTNSGARGAADKSPQLWETIREFGIVASRFNADPEVARLVSELPLLRSVCDVNFAGMFAPVFAHNDLLMGNFLLEVEEDGSQEASPPVIHLIDYEYSCYGELCYDLANMFNEFAGFECRWEDVPAEADMRRFLSFYFSCEADDESRRRRRHRHREEGQCVCAVRDDVDLDVDAAMEQIKVYMLVSHLFWSTWSVIQAHTSKIDFDYRAYAARRSEKYWKDRDDVLRRFLPPSGEWTPSGDGSQDV